MVMNFNPHILILWVLIGNDNAEKKQLINLYNWSRTETHVHASLELQEL